MPNDPNLYPGIASPPQELYQRIAALEFRMQTQERHRDVIVTPINQVVGAGSTTVSIPFTWYGGRLWGMFGGRGQNATASQPATVGYSVKLNSYGPFSLGVRGTSTNAAFDWALGMSAAELPAAAALTLGNNNLTVQFFAGLAADNSYTVSGLLIEWPLA